MATGIFSPNFTKHSYVIEASYPRHPSTVIDAKARLQVAVDEYVIHNACKEGITVIFAHGTSFNKMLWEPTISRLLKSFEQHRCIKRILALDATNHGESWLLNSTRLTNEC